MSIKSNNSWRAHNNSKYNNGSQNYTNNDKTLVHTKIIPVLDKNEMSFCQKRLKNKCLVSKNTTIKSRHVVHKHESLF